MTPPKLEIQKPVERRHATLADMTLVSIRLVHALHKVDPNNKQGLEALRYLVEVGAMGGREGDR